MLRGLIPVSLLCPRLKQLRVVMKLRGRRRASEPYCINSTERPKTLAAVLLVIQNAKVLISAVDEI